MSEIAAIDERLLPPLLRRLVRVIGLPATLLLLEKRGGIPLEIPRRGHASPGLVEIIGAEAAQQLAAEFAGMDKITLPMADKLHTQLRDRAIRAEHAPPLDRSLSQLALRYRLSRRQIQNIIGESDTEPTGDLFDAPRTA